MLEETIKKYNIDSVVHFAAYSLVGESMEKPEIYLGNGVGFSDKEIIETAYKWHKNHLDGYGD